MIVESIARAIAAAPWTALDSILEANWKAWIAGGIGDLDAQGFAEQIVALKAAGRARMAEGAPRKRRGEPGAARAATRTGGEGRSGAKVGSKPRTEEGLRRRRRWAASGFLPPLVAADFTLGRQAVLAVVASEVVNRGDCRLTVGKIAAMAGVCETLVRQALKAARTAGLVTVEERRVHARRNLSNIVRVVDRTLVRWLERRRKREPQDSKNDGTENPEEPREVGAPSCGARSSSEERRPWKSDPGRLARGKEETGTSPNLER